MFRSVVCELINRHPPTTDPFGFTLIFVNYNNVIIYINGVLLITLFIHYILFDLHKGCEFKT